LPLARAALYARGIDVYLAPTWDNSDVWVPTLRHITAARPAVTDTPTGGTNGHRSTEDLTGQQSE
jgi:hypothetical protein